MPYRHFTLIGRTWWNVVRFCSELTAGLLDPGWRVAEVTAFSGQRQGLLRRRGVVAW